MMKKRRMLQQGCHGFLFRVVNNSESRATSEDIPVAKGYLEVFPNDLYTLPLDKNTV